MVSLSFNNTNMKLLRKIIRLLFAGLLFYIAFLIGTEFAIIFYNGFVQKPTLFKKEGNISKGLSFNSSINEVLAAKHVGVNVSSVKIGSENIPSLKEIPKKPAKVLLFSHGRSGSSYIGQLLASAPNTFFLYEPSHPVKRLTRPVSFPDHFQGLYSCEQWAYDIIANADVHVVSSKGMEPTVQYCYKASVILIKSVSYRFNNSIDWLLRNPEIKVIYLVRDPRGVYASTPTHWDTGKRPIEERCDEFNSDLSWFRRLPPEQARILKYEDVVADPIKTTKSIYEFANIDFFEKDIENFVESHYSDEKHPYVYMGLDQPKNFSPSHKWVKLPRFTIEKIEKHCYEYMKAFEYPFLKN